ncbi:MAG: TetR/AcrR family transcriptional regulator [Treponema sp.]|jgi:AcrR family transcriptional regulator|nr:TetR/AcrR family transcriptional regulator [Treponema sp.]
MPRTKEAFSAMRETTRGKIEAAALSLFARKGLSVTIDEIAKKAGLSKGLLYSHYPSKEALISELMRQAAVNAGTSVKKIADGDNSADVKIKQITAMMCEMLSSSQIGIDYVMFTIQAGMSGFLMPEAGLYTADNPHPVESLARIIASAQAEGSAAKGDPVQLALVFWAAVEGLCCFAVTGIMLPPVFETLSRIILKEEKDDN